MRIEETDHPLLYEINTRLWVKEISQQREGFTLAHVPDSALDEIVSLNFDLVWLMGVWQTGPMGQAIARQVPSLMAEYQRILPDCAPEDVIGSPYAVQRYRVAEELGGPGALADLRRRLARRGIGLILDFVPNHTACDHPWLLSHPEFYVTGEQDQAAREGEAFFTAETNRGKRSIAHGRDPYFPPWSDTAQLNCCHRGMRVALIEALVDVAGQCDGVRCDMAMLLLQEVFARTWGTRAKPGDGTEMVEGEFWLEAIEAVRRRYPNFIFTAEVYWGLEAKLQDLGFDYTYDKTLYDRLIHEGAPAVCVLLHAPFDFQKRSVRFLENHDERRAAELLASDKHQAAALICYGLPGMRFFHEGQLDGRRLKVPVQLGRRPMEKQDRELRGFYQKLLAELGMPVLRRGRWRQLEPRAAWSGNPSWAQFVIFRWEGPTEESRQIAVNFGPQPAQCYVSLDLPALQGKRVVLRDLLSGVTYERDGSSLNQPGLYLDMAPYQGHLFALNPV